MFIQIGEHIINMDHVERIGPIDNDCGGVDQAILMASGDVILVEKSVAGDLESAELIEVHDLAQILAWIKAGRPNQRANAEPQALSQ